MSVELTFYNSTADRRYGHKFFLRIIKTAAKVVGLANSSMELALGDTGLALSLVSKAKIKWLNLKYRGENTVTDVLSFGLGKTREVTQPTHLPTLPVPVPKLNWPFGTKGRGDAPKAMGSTQVQPRHRDGKTDPSPRAGDSRIMELGDIFICLPLAKEQAQDEGIGLATRLTELTIHGFLHLAGYDHERYLKERQKMFALQEKVLKKCANT